MAIIQNSSWSTSDGKVFKTVEEAEAHEAFIQESDAVSKALEQFFGSVSGHKYQGRRKVTATRVITEFLYFRAGFPGSEPQMSEEEEETEEETEEEPLQEAA